MKISTIEEIKHTLIITMSIIANAIGNTVMSGVEKIEKAPSAIIETIESLPSDIAEGINEGTRQLGIVNEAVKNATSPENYENTKGIIQNTGSLVVSSIDTNAVQNVFVDAVVKATGTSTEAIKRGIEVTPIIGPLFIGVSSAIDIGSNLIKSGTQLGNVVNNAIQEGTNKVNKNNGILVSRPFTTINPTDESQPSPPVNPSPQNGGAKKTRKHMKKVIRDRVLIQSRTNKMIHDFLNPNDTIKRVKTIKKKRRRNK